MVLLRTGMGLFLLEDGGVIVSNPDGGLKLDLFLTVLLEQPLWEDHVSLWTRNTPAMRSYIGTGPQNKVGITQLSQSTA